MSIQAAIKFRVMAMQDENLLRCFLFYAHRDIIIIIEKSPCLKLMHNI